MSNDSKFPHGSLATAFEIQAKGTASPEAQVKYLMQVVKVKDDRIATLELEVQTLKLKGELHEMRVVRSLEALQELNDQIRGGPRDTVPEALPEDKLSIWPIAAILVLAFSLVLLLARTWRSG